MNNGQETLTVEWRGHRIGWSKINGEVYGNYLDTCAALGVAPQLQRPGEHMRELTITHRGDLRSMMKSCLAQLELRVGAGQ